MSAPGARAHAHNGPSFARTAARHIECTPRPPITGLLTGAREFQDALGGFVDTKGKAALDGALQGVHQRRKAFGKQQLLRHH